MIRNSSDIVRNEILLKMLAVPPNTSITARRAERPKGEEVGTPPVDIEIFPITGEIRYFGNPVDEIWVCSFSPEKVVFGKGDYTFALYYRNPDASRKPESG